MVASNPPAVAAAAEAKPDQEPPAPSSQQHVEEKNRAADENSTQTPAPTTEATTGPSDKALEAGVAAGEEKKTAPESSSTTKPREAEIAATAAALAAEKKETGPSPRPSVQTDLDDDVYQADFQGEVVSNDELPSAETIRRIENYIVLDRHGKTHTFRSLYTGRSVARRVLLIFVRHFFCGNCQEYLRSLSASITAESLLQLPIPTFIAVVGCGDPHLIDMYASETGCPFPIYADPTRKLYQELGMVKTLALGSRPAYMNKSILKSSLDSIVQGVKQIKKGLVLKAGDQRQIGGEFLFEPLDIKSPELESPSHEFDRKLRLNDDNKDKNNKPAKTDGERLAEAEKRSRATSVVTDNDNDEEEEPHLVEEKKVTWCHRMRTTRDHAEIPELMEVLGLTGHGKPTKDQKRWSKALDSRKGTGLSLASRMSRMSQHKIRANAGIYGLGIRVTFYLQWFGMIITSWVLESDALNLKFINALTTAATSVGLVLNLGELRSVEIYIVLLLTSGALYFAVPVYLWRLMTCCRPWWDPERWTRIKMGWLFRVFTSSIYGALLGLHVWFWCTGVHDRRKMDATSDTGTGTGTDCEQFGFFFAQVSLDSPGMVTANIILHFTILLVGTGVSAIRVAPGAITRADADWCGLPSITRNRISSLQHFQTICDLIVAAIVTLAIELVISWNRITDANDVDSAAQLIPPVITGAHLAHSLCVCFTGSDRDSEDSDGPYFSRGTLENRGHPPRRRRYTSGGPRRSSYRRRRSRGASRASPDFLDPHTDMFDLSGLSMPTTPASLGGSAPPASGYYNMASDYYGMYNGDPVGDEVPPVRDDLGQVPPEPPPAASLHGRSRDSSIGGEGFIRL
ncbi:hypothetical protein diail_6395 [Diaporthe ilicicola]|nr:hypothetical protein diail_6395 [Diaporthe ilicicola]